MSALLLCLIAVLPLLFYISQRSRWYFLDPINTFWIIYLYVAFLQPLANWGNWISFYGETSMTKALALLLAAGATTILGYRMKAGPKIAKRLPVIGFRDQAGRYAAMGLCCLLVGLLGYAIVVRASGGWDQYTSVARTATHYGKISGYVLNLTGLVPLGLFLLLCYSFTKKWTYSFKACSWCGLGFYTLWTIYRGSRSGLIGIAIILLGCVYGMRKKNPSVLAGGIALLSVILLVGFVKSYREYFVERHLKIEDTWEQMLGTSLESYLDRNSGGEVGLGTEFGMTIAAAHYIPDQVGYDYGYMLLELLTRGIPRALWPDKVYPEGEAWDRFHRAAHTAEWTNAAGLLSGPAPGLAAKWYYMFGYPGILLGGLWTGLFLQCVKCYVSRYSGISNVVLAVGTVNLGFGEMNNPLLWPISWLPSTGLILLLVLFVARRRTLKPGRVSNSTIFPVGQPAKFLPLR